MKQHIQKEEKQTVYPPERQSQTGGTGRGTHTVYMEGRYSTPLGYQNNRGPKLFSHEDLDPNKFIFCFVQFVAHFRLYTLFSLPWCFCFYLPPSFVVSLTLSFFFILFPLFYSLSSAFFFLAFSFPPIQIPTFIPVNSVFHN